MLFWGFLVVVIFAGLQKAAAQTTDATCLVSYEWAFNSLHQSPCLVAAYALGACASGVYNVDPLNPSTHYLGPTPAGANACQCSTVAYSLISACGDCQNRTYEAWSSWSSNCHTSYRGSFPRDIPPATAIPAWAYLDVDTNDTYNPALAKLDTNATESTAASKPTTIFTGTFSTTTLTTTTSSSISPTSSSINDSTLSWKANVIGGSVSAGLLCLTILVSLILCFVVRRRRMGKAIGLLA